MNELVKEKLAKALMNLTDIAIHIDSRDKHKTCGDLRYVEENIQECIHLIIAEKLEEKERLEDAEGISHESVKWI